MDIADTAVSPAAGIVDQAGRIELLHPLRKARRVHLAPAFIEDDPHHDRGMVEMSGDEGL